MDEIILKFNSQVQREGRERQGEVLEGVGKVHRDRRVQELRRGGRCEGRGIVEK